MRIRFLIFLFFQVAFLCSLAQDPLLTNIPARKKISLNGTWHYILDPYETGYYDYRWRQRNEKDREAYWNTDVPASRTDRIEHGYTDEYGLKVPGDWNAQDPKFLYYEGTVWYQKSFDFEGKGKEDRVFLHFGAVNYRADVFLNGRKLGMHLGGFTPFNFEVPDTLLRKKGNFLVVKVDNKRMKEEIPTLNTDWWNYGGITRDVNLVIVPPTFIRDYSFGLAKGAATARERFAEGWIRFSRPVNETVTLEIPELKWKQQVKASGDSVPFRVRLPRMQLWSPENPQRYNVVIHSGADRVEERIGFRTVEVSGTSILLNGKPLFLRGICLHEEFPLEIRRAHSEGDARWLLGKAKELNANMVRLAHYPHNEHMTRMADSLGLLVWSEVPVYWTIDFTNPEVLRKAKVQLEEMITRDRNRASIIIWSVGNETPVHAARTAFMTNLVLRAKELDQSRLVSAALEVHNVNGVHVVDDPLGQHTDLVSVNEYIGWYGGLPSNARTAQWKVVYDKPFFISETGAEALGGYHGDSLTRWSEEYQEWYYKEQTEMMRRMPPHFAGTSPWILLDFRSPRRNNPLYQEGWNNKGIFDQKGKPKKAFAVLKAYYDEMERKYRK